MVIDNQTLILRIGGALLLGGIVGYEREREQKPAGLRTIMLVTVGSALAMLMGQRLSDFMQIDPSISISLNPTRLLSALMQGVGFLGAGTIFTSQRTVHGLTTAAAVWAMATVGVAIGVGDWMLAIAGTVAAFFTLRILGPWGAQIGQKE